MASVQGTLALRVNVANVARALPFPALLRVREMVPGARAVDVVRAERHQRAVRALRRQRARLGAGNGADGRRAGAGGGREPDRVHRVQRVRVARADVRRVAAVDVARLEVHARGLALAALRERAGPRQRHVAVVEGVALDSARVRRLRLGPRDVVNLVRARLLRRRRRHAMADDGERVLRVERVDDARGGEELGLGVRVLDVAVVDDAVVGLVHAVRDLPRGGRAADVLSGGQGGLCVNFAARYVDVDPARAPSMSSVRFTCRVDVERRVCRLLSSFSVQLVSRFGVG
eukprot:CAMPEP_0174851490 /NCGR_PEP_ID=MMETSP1114-20130205/23217_1 /TAXON_ID=312471 /ORGANISM="Neobodo designis, Strain CCAP 1951/1" /LENGTH=287 /DNA_ID=CAMNT_0016086029 /DNA_START=70 /DNA_END=934 /DNA_ORIENTATION=-